MKLRLGQMLGQAVEGMPWLGTFHSIGGRILRIHAELVQLKSNFTVLDVDDQVRLLKQLLQAENIDDKRWPARMLAGLIDSWKNRGLSPSQVPAGEAASFGNGKGGKIYATYQERLKILNAADFGDLLLENIRLFRENPDVLRQYQNRFKFILVDEYQDTNRLQSSILLALKPAGHGLTVVGDDAQSIYSFRAATVRNILDFPSQFSPAAEIVTLDRNYRSTQPILSAANGVISLAKERFTKNLWSDRTSTRKPLLVTVRDEADQARYIVTVPAADAGLVLAKMKGAGVPCARIGTTGGDAIAVAGEAPVAVETLARAFEHWLPNYMRNGAA